MRFLFRLFLWSLLAIALSILAVFLNYHLIGWYSNSRITVNTEHLNSMEYALIPGAGHHKPHRWTNHTFNNRILAAVTLYKSGKISKIVVSGTYTNQEYNEVGDMRNVLLTFGIPEKDIVSDTLVTRTWDSVENLEKRFGVQSVIIVTQRKQLERAIFISGCVGIEAVGFVAASPSYSHRYWIIREYLARVKASCDCISYIAGIKK